MGMIKEFKDFINKGSVIDMAVGLILATYFGAIVKSLVNDIIMPPIGKLLGGVDFSSLKYVIQEGQAAVMSGETVVTPAVGEVAIGYGVFINTIILIINSFCFQVLRVHTLIKGAMNPNHA